MSGTGTSKVARVVVRLFGLVAISCAALFSLPSPSMAVIGGEADGTDHPFVGAQDNRHCGVGIGSGVLVSPTVFVTSGHGAHFCLDQGITRTRVTFDPVFSDSGTFYEGTIYAHPGYAGAGKANDVGVMVLDQPVVGITPAALGHEGFLDALGPQGL